MEHNKTKVRKLINQQESNNFRFDRRNRRKSKSTTSGEAITNRMTTSTIEPGPMLHHRLDKSRILTNRERVLIIV